MTAPWDAPESDPRADLIAAVQAVEAEHLGGIQQSCRCPACTTGLPADLP